jgi:glutathione synthase/RimK-type ligase-like ATP-grasp enzyme
VVEAARRLGLQTLVFNQRRAQDIDLQLSAGNPDGAWALDGKLAIDRQAFLLSDFCGVYNRLMDYHSLPEFKAEAAQAQIANLHGLFSAWLEVAPLRVMNRFSAMTSNLSKPYQSQLIAQAGFLIPPTLVTNDPDIARLFIAEHGRAVYKSISSVRSVVGEVRRPGAASLEKIRYLPTQFQALIPGQDVRVHVVGEQVFATRITSSAVDYRYAAASGEDVEMQAIELEQDVRALCLDLARLLNLPLCGIDLRQTPSGDWYCFEANPSPAFSYYQEGAGQDIAAAIVAHLAGMP